MVAQVDEQKPAVIADAMNPTREANDGADMRLAQLAAGMCPINMHEEVSPGALTRGKSAWRLGVVKLRRLRRICALRHRAIATGGAQF